MFLFKPHKLFQNMLLKSLCIIFIVFGLSACVTTTNSSLTDKADPDVAVNRYVQLGLEYIKRNDLHRARKHLSRALEINPIDASANASMGLIYHQESENDKAEELFKLAIDSDPSYTPGRTYYGAFLFSQKRYAESLEEFKLAAKDTRYEGRDQVFANIALCQIKLNNQSLAIDAYLKALQLDRTNGIALSGLTELYITTDNFDKAQHYYNRLVRLIRENGMQHTPQSLWQGIRIAHYFKSREQTLGLAYLLNEMYPESDENQSAANLLNSTLNSTKQDNGERL